MPSQQSTSEEVYFSLFYFYISQYLTKKICDAFVLF